MRTITKKQEFIVAENHFLDYDELTDALREMPNTNDVTQYSVATLMALLDITRRKLAEQPGAITATIGRLEKQYRDTPSLHREIIRMVRGAATDTVALIDRYAAL